MSEASSPIGKRRQQTPAAGGGEDDDSVEDLREVSFPVIDHAAKTGGAAEATPSDEGHAITAPSAATLHATGSGSGTVDEDAALRCFRMSVDAHVAGRGSVAEFEPSPPK